MRRIYLDHAATTPVRPEAIDVIMAALREAGNPSSLHAEGRRARERLDSARENLADTLGCQAAELILTSGGTESVNLAFFGVAGMRSDRKHLLLSAVEHHAALHTAEALQASGCEVELIPVDRHGRIAATEAIRRIRPDTALVSVMLANNEIGTLQPVREIASAASSQGVLVHTDAIQAVGRLPVDVGELGVDLLSTAAHKFGGPPGIGALYVREGVELRPLLFGGAQERGRRGGTESAALAAGMDAAVTAFRRAMSAESGREMRLLQQLREQLALVGDVWFNTPEGDALPSILNVGFRNVRAETLLLAMDLEGLAASSGSACASGSMEPSHVLRAIGLSPDEARSCIRFSIGWTTTGEEVEQAAEIVKRAVERIRERRRNTGG